MSDVVHVRRTIVVEYDVGRDEYGSLTDDEIVAYETLGHNEDGGWRIIDYDDGNVKLSSAEVMFR